MKKNNSQNQATKKIHVVYEIIGWYGTVAIVGAYLLVSFNLLKASDPLYQILNLSGALGILIISLVKRVYQSVALETVWGTIAVVALIQILFFNR